MPPLIKTLSAVVSLLLLLLVSLIVDCHATPVNDRRLTDSTIGIPIPVAFNAEAIRQLLAMKSRQQYSSLPISENRPPLLALDAPPINENRPPLLALDELSKTVLKPLKKWERYDLGDDKFYEFQVPYTPAIQLLGHDALETLRRGDWVRAGNKEQPVDSPTFMQWVRCQDETTTPSIMEIVRDTGRAIFHINAQLREALDSTKISTASFNKDLVFNIMTFRYKGLHCMYLDENLSTPILSPSDMSTHDVLEKHFVALLTDIKLMHWYNSTGQALRFGRYDTSRWSTGPEEEVGRNAISLPILYASPGDATSIKEHGWRIIKKTARSIIRIFGRVSLLSPHGIRGTLWLKTQLILRICNLIDNIRLPAQMTFNELVERIAELTNYPYYIGMGWPALDARLDELKIAANFPLLLAASQLYEQARRAESPSETNQKSGSPVQDSSIFFMAARMDRVVTPEEIERLRWITMDVTPYWLNLMQTRVNLDKGFKRDNPVNQRNLAFAKASKHLRKTFKLRGNLQKL